MSNLQPLNQFPTLRDDIRSLADNMAREILDGNADPLIAWVRIKAMQELCDQVQKMIKDYATDEAEKYGETFEKLGAKMEVINSGVKYDYASSGDPVWIDLNKKITELENRRKAQESFLKTIPDTGTVDPDTGTVIHAPGKHYGRSIKVTFK